ncbi:hypothetical protein [Sedimentibacter sp. MB31-C6]|uniref:hypothetical protein n=1 Tax=Sedimentibacter sp. MB31-C6 TaxID=3109366 RepID=UPI002DDDAC3A|nr:hypothetical protein [Sedimentibacter sp. MB36-C1]WSI05140.1 hypothetical protein U8307_04935 [Sedimentibacter sp. MB36-C1]
MSGLKNKKRNDWDVVLGIHKTNNFEPDEEFKKLIKKEINGEISTEDIIKLTVDKYKEDNFCSNGTEVKEVKDFIDKFAQI